MKKTLVIYRSKYGSAKRYAEWIAEALDADLRDERAVKPADFEAYDILIGGGNVQASSVKGIQKLKLAASRLLGKTMAFFAVGAMTGDPEYQQALTTRNVGSLAVPLFALPGRVDFPAMSRLDRSLMKMIVGMLKDQKDLKPAQRALVGNVGGVCDLTDRAAIEPLLAFVRQ